MLPVIKIVSTNSLVVHETVDEARVKRLEKRFRVSTVFTNPPLVAQLENGKYVVLDGANRTTVCKNIKLPCVPVQVVKYADSTFQLLTWNHVVAGVNWSSWWNQVRQLPGLVIFKLTKRVPLKNFGAIIQSAGGDLYGIVFPKDKKTALTSLNDLVNTYKGKYQLYRTAELDTKAVKEMYSNFTALVVFPPLNKKYILYLATNHLKIPSGISRHVIPGRALRIDVPFSLLRSNKSMTAKNKWLGKFIEDLKNANRIRLYSEPVYLFNE